MVGAVAGCRCGGRGAGVGGRVWISEVTHTVFWEEKEQKDKRDLEKSVTSLTGRARNSYTLSLPHPLCAGLCFSAGKPVPWVV